MLTTRVLTSLAAAAALAIAPAASSAQPIRDRADKPHAERCYQLNPVVPGQPRGVHRVPCGVDAPDGNVPRSSTS
jgi:hypothetical protein